MFGQHRKLIQNIFSLSVLQFLNMAIPLITLPYLMRVVGMAGYGSYSIAYSLIQYIMLISAYGFGFSTTRAISINRDNKDKVSGIFCSTMAARAILSILSTIAIAIIIMLLYNRNDIWLMVLLGMGIVIGDILNPIWLYQGMEEMKYMTLVNFVCKFLSTLLIFIFIKEEGDYIYIILFNSIGFITSGILSTYIAVKRFSLKLGLPRRTEIIQELKDGIHIFLSTIFMNLYRNSNILILGLFLNEYMVGIYAGAEKITKTAQSVANPISTALYPNMSSFISRNSVSTGKEKLKKIFFMMSLVLVAISLSIFAAAPLINRILLDNTEILSTNLIRCMVPVILLGGLNYILGIVGLTNMGYKEYFLKAVVISGLASLVIVFGTVNEIGCYSAAAAMCVSEIILFVLCSYKLYRIR